MGPRSLLLSRQHGSTLPLRPRHCPLQRAQRQPQDIGGIAVRPALALAKHERRALHRLEAKEVRALRRLLPRFQELIGRLDALGPPPTLVHGALHPGNATRLDGRIAYFDWTDACVAHPFVDLHSLQWERDQATRESLLHAYLEPWRDAAMEETLREAVAVAHVVTPLHHAVSYATIARSLESTSRSELDATHEFLREAMTRVREV